jgi:hypothetical protein
MCSAHGDTKATPNVAHLEWPDANDAMYGMMRVHYHYALCPPTCFSKIALAFPKI